jgi:hypothetical protein
VNTTTDLGFGKREIFFARGLDRFSRAGVICPSGSHIAVTQRTAARHRHCEEHLRRSNPFFLFAARWIASLRSQ